MIMKHLSKILKTITVVLAVVMGCTFMLAYCADGKVASLTWEKRLLRTISVRGIPLRKQE